MSVSTKQRQIAELAGKHASEPLTSLHHYLDEPWLREAWRQLSRSSAVGIDGQSVKEYGRQLEANLRSLLGRARSGGYRAPAVRRVHIPKGDGKETRPIGIPTTEDKLLQRAVVMLLEPIYEKEFYDFSFGFRPGRSAHQALNALWSGIMENRVRWIVDVDIRKFFDTLDHGKLRAILDRRIKDGVVRRLIDKWLAAGVMEAGEWSCPEAGTPQGGVVSPLLSNIFLHEVLDDWFARAVKPRLKGRGFMVRYADDLVMGFQSREDAQRVMAVLPKRLARFGLSLNAEKSKLVAFAPPGLRDPVGRPVGSFEFLGFTHYWGRNRQGRWVVKRKTARKRLARALKAVGQWCRDNRHEPLAQQHRVLRQKLAGHFAYYGMTGNGRSLHRFREGVRRLWHKWLNRRTRRRDTLSWERFAQLCAQHYPLPVVRITHSVIRAKPSTGGTGCV